MPFVGVWIREKEWWCSCHYPKIIGLFWFWRDYNPLEDNIYLVYKWYFSCQLGDYMLPTSHLLQRSNLNFLRWQKCGKPDDAKFKWASCLGYIIQGMKHYPVIWGLYNANITNPYSPRIQWKLRPVFFSWLKFSLSCYFLMICISLVGHQAGKLWPFWFLWFGLCFLVWFLTLEKTHFVHLRFLLLFWVGVGHFSCTQY